jgi:hypothetical protein
MRRAKHIIAAVAAIWAVFFLVGIGILTAQTDRPGKPDPKKPVPATDIALVKKVTLKGGRPSASGPKKAEAATGILGDPLQGRRYAIVVGISDYPGTVNDLEYADDDAVDVENALKTAYGFTHITSLTDGEATREAIINAIRALSGQVRAGDEVVFFFSGHGMNGAAEDGDAEKMDEAVVAHDGSQIVPIWDGELREEFSGFAASRILFIFDICLAGGMQEDLQGPGRVILMACGERSYSYEGDQWQNGEFTYYFADQGILSGKANVHDYDNDKQLGEVRQVTAEEAFDYATANCFRDRPVIDDEFANDLLP